MPKAPREAGPGGTRLKTHSTAEVHSLSENLVFRNVTGLTLKED